MYLHSMASLYSFKDTHSGYRKVKLLYNFMSILYNFILFLTQTCLLIYKILFIIDCIIFLEYIWISYIKNFQPLKIFHYRQKGLVSLIP